ncbi:MAG: ATP-binding cassette domain-containing protein [Nitrososphaeria archaeon]|jgi:simple sugar transport system ATP-binding protein
MTQEKWLLDAQGITKRFGSVDALKKVDLQVGYNECVALLGDNGAGKSTLIKCIVGVHPINEGKIYFEGKEVSFASPADARGAGIDIVYQDANLVDSMNVWRNFFLAKERTRGWGPFKLLRVGAMRDETLSRIGAIGIGLRSSDEEIGVMSGGERQSIAMARANYFGIKLLFLDEPLTALSVVERDKVTETLNNFKEHNISFIYITHNIYEAFSIADRFEILDRGVKVISLSKKERPDLTPEDITNMLRKAKLQEGSH